MSAIEQLLQTYYSLYGALAPYIGTFVKYQTLASSCLPKFPYPIFYVAAAAIVLHVANYNATAQLEHKTRIFTKVIFLWGARDVEEMNSGISMI